MDLDNDEINRQINNFIGDNGAELPLNEGINLYSIYKIG